MEVVMYNFVKTEFVNDYNHLHMKLFLYKTIRD